MKSDSDETGYESEDEASVISDDELSVNERTPSESSSNDQESDEDSEIGHNENFWLTLLNDYDPEGEIGKLKNSENFVY